MKSKFFNSFSVRLSLRFMFVMTVAVVLLSVAFLFFVRSLVNKNQEMELKVSEDVVFQKLEETRSANEFGSKFGESLGSIQGLPYYITYIVYNAKDFTLLATNDPFLPYLEDSHGKVKYYFEKNYFFDGDLNIIYYAKYHSESKNEIIVAVAINMDFNMMAKMFSNLPFALLFFAIPILILSFLISLFITKKTISPVVKITRAARSITSENLSDLLPVSGNDDEIDELSETFNSLFLRLKQDFNRERQFSSDVSHELNTPLTVISGQTNLLLRWGKNNPEQLEKSLKAIKTESKTMQSIIANLLQISRIESGRIKPQVSRVSLADMFSWLTEEFSEIAPKAKICSTPNEIVLSTDEEMLHQILTILISNSLKYAGESCVINLSAFKKGSLIVIEESDDGPGISKESLPYIFERFYRADESHARKISGSGLGLAIAQTLCNALNAKIKARNMVPHGAGFSIEFLFA